MSIADAVHSAGVAIQHTVNNITKHAENKAVQAAKNEAPKESSSSSEASESTGGTGTDKVELSDKAAEEVENSYDSKDTKKLDESIDKYHTDKKDGLEDEDYTRIAGTDGSDEIDVTINKDGSCTVVVNGEEQSYTAEEASRLLIEAGKGDDAINIHQEATRRSSIDIAIDGGDGNDTIKADDNVSQNLFITGGKGDDNITGGKGNDTIVDNYGSNTIHGGAGDDDITAESVDESSWWQKIGNFFSGNNAAPKQTIYGDEGNDTIHAGKGNDFINGGDGDDAIYAGSGSDCVIGGQGRDYIEGGYGDDVIYGGDGGDIIYAGHGNDFVNGGEGDDFINGGKGDDRLRGNNGNDIMFGLDGNDDIAGGAGDDVIASGRGKDIVDGGAGADTIRTTTSVFGGGDTVNNADDSDDIKVLNPITVPDNFQINSGEEGRFADVINDNLEAMACIEPGQAMLQTYAATGHNMIFTEIDDQNCYASAIGNGSAASVTYNDDGTRTVVNGTGTDSYIKINPAFNTMSNKDWGEANTLVLMAHEMSHAYNNAMGNKDYEFYNNETGEHVEMPAGSTTQDGWAVRAIRGAEQQAVGMFDGSNIAPNPYGISENDYRAYFHMHLRDSYMNQSAAQHQQSIDAGNALPDEYKDYQY